MGSKLTSANPYLRDPKVRERTVVASVATSSAIEGIRAPFKQALSASGSLRARNGGVITKKS